jgi:hypothetical protein
MADTEMAHTSHSRRRLGPDVRTLLLGFGLVAASLSLILAVVPHLGAVGERPRLPWWELRSRSRSPRRSRSTSR